MKVEFGDECISVVVDDAGGGGGVDVGLLVDWLSNILFEFGSIFDIYYRGFF